MNAAPRSANQRTPLALVTLAVLAAGGMVVGWLLPASYSSTIEQVRAVLDPICMGALCIGLIHLQVKQRRATLVATLLCCCSFVAMLLAVLRD
jgi:predicted membrane protein